MIFSLKEKRPYVTQAQKVIAANLRAMVEEVNNMLMVMGNLGFGDVNYELKTSLPYILDCCCIDVYIMHVLFSQASSLHMWIYIYISCFTPFFDIAIIEFPSVFIVLDFLTG